MLNSVIYLSGDLRFFSNSWPAVGNGIYPSLLLEDAASEKILEAYKFWSGHKPENFSIAVRLSNSINKSSLPGLISFFFIPGYLTANNKKIFTLLGSSKEILLDAKQQLLAFSARQGIENLVIYCTGTGETTVPEGLPADDGITFSDTGTLLGSYKETAEAGGAKTLFFLPNAWVDVQGLSAMIAATENEIKNNHPSAYRLAVQIQQANIENDLLRKKNLSVANELNNYKLHLETMRSSHEAKELQAYYDSEYEILPRWYKRFGHIVKVITGKRSLRSLFSDNPKKHSH